MGTVRSRKLMVDYAFPVFAFEFRLWRPMCFLMACFCLPCLPSGITSSAISYNPSPHGHRAVLKRFFVRGLDSFDLGRNIFWFDYFHAEFP